MIGVGANATAGTFSTINAATTCGPMSNIASAATAAATAYMAIGNPNTFFRGAANNVYAGWWAHARAKFPDASYDNTGAGTGSRLWVLGFSGNIASLLSADRGTTQR